MAKKYVKVGGELENIVGDGIIAAASKIKDYNKDKTQEEINTETDSALADRYTMAETNALINAKLYELGAVEIDDIPRENSQKLVRSGSVYDAYAHLVYLSEDDELPSPVDFNPQADTVWNKPGQILSEAQKKNIRANIGLGDGDIDNEPTAGSDNLVKSGGIQNELALGAVYDVSAKNPTGGPNSDGKFTLEYILSNANTLIPTAIRKGGMSIKFVQSSDNKYVGFSLTKDEWSANVNDWQGITQDIKQNSQSIRDIQSSVITNEDNDTFYVTDKKGNVIAKIDENGVKSVDYLDKNGSSLLTQLLGKVDKIVGKGLSTNDFTDELKDKLENSGSVEDVFNLYDDTFYVTDKDGNVAFKINKDGKIVFNGNNEDLQIQIPDVVYAIVDTELNLWNDTISLSVDRGLASPLNYQVRWACNKGLITDRCFRYTPVAADAGNTYTCTCYLYNMNNALIVSKQFSIKVLAKNALHSSKNIAYFGDSLGAASAEALYNNFHNSDKYTGTIPIMFGTDGTTFKYDAVGGYGWAQYATAGQPGYRVYVSGITSVSLGARYSDGSHDFEVYEVNITEGSGNLLLRSYFTNYGPLIMPSGTLTKIGGGGDSLISYTDAFQESSNPLWNDTTQKLDVSQYKTLVGLQSTDKIDAVSFQFGINDNNLANDLDTLLGYIDDLYHCFVDDNADCKFIIGLTTSSGNDINGSGANYGATRNWYDYLKNVYTIRQFYLSLQNNQNYPNIRIAPTHLEVDRYYGYNFSIRKISQSFAGATVTDGTHSIELNEYEVYHNNYVHPGNGYRQIGDAYLATYIGVLTENLI